MPHRGERGPATEQYGGEYRHICFDYADPIVTNTVLTTVSMSIGIDLVDGQRNTMLIHPSPTTGASNIRWLGKATEDVWIDFADAIGRTVYQGSVQALQHAQNVAFDLTSLPAGSFIVRMYGDYYDARALW